MPQTLRIRLVGAQQSWGTRSRFENRDTEDAPTKSGVVGLLAAALGRAREEPVTDLARLRMGVRVDRPGTRMTDYHTALQVVSSEGKLNPGKDTVVSKRDYLADAAFLVGLEAEDLKTLQALQAALEQPRWPLFLGRRAFPPSLPVPFLTDDEPQPICDMSLEEVLVTTPPVVNVDESKFVTYLIEHQDGEQEWMDQPTSDFKTRSFRPRRVKVVSAPRGVRWF